MMKSKIHSTGGKCSSFIEINHPECSSAATESISSSEKDLHIVKIKISPEHKKNINQKQTVLDVKCNDFLSTGCVQSEFLEVNNNSKKTIVSLNQNILKNNQMLEVNSFVHPMSKTTRTFLSVSEKFESNCKIDTKPINKNRIEKNFDNNTAKANEMIQKSSNNEVLEVHNPTYLYYMMTSGQCSPSDTLDSGTCSDMDNNNNNSNNNNTNSTSDTSAPPPLLKKMGSKSKLHLKSTRMVQEIQNMKNDYKNSSQSQTEDSSKHSHHNHSRTGSLTDSEESESSLSCDSLNSSEFTRSSMYAPSPPLAPITSKELNARPRQSFLPDSLLRDIRDRKFIGINKNIRTHNDDDNNNKPFKISSIPSKSSSSSSSVSLSLPSFINQSQNGNCLKEKNKTRIVITKNEENNKLVEKFENDKFYTFHINEKDSADLVENEPKIIHDETFAGLKDVNLDTDTDTSTIRSSKGTVRGVKNRVRNGIATFLQMQQLNVKNYKEKDCGKVVLYTTSMGIVRETYAKCTNVKQILRTLLVKFEERDIFMRTEYQQEIKERMQSDEIQVPQLFVEGQYIGDAETVERLNESGELRKMLKQYKSISASYTCQVCGGYRLLPCPSCNGSKKSVHRNHFTAEFVALKCMNCDEVGLVKCHNC